MGQKFKNVWEKCQCPPFWSRMQCSIVDVLRRCVKSEHCWSNALIVKLSKQLLNCSGGTSQGRGCVLTLVFYSQSSSLPSSLIGFQIIRNHEDWKKHKFIRRGGAISEQLLLLFSSQWFFQVCVRSWILLVQVFPIICMLIFTMLSKMTSFPGVDFLSLGMSEGWKTVWIRQLLSAVLFQNCGVCIVQDCAGNFPPCAWALTTIYRRKMEVLTFGTQQCLLLISQ